MHDEERVLTHATQSDVDIVVGSPPHTILARSLDALHANNLYPIVINAYDAGGSASAYMATERAENGLQLDMYYDPKGVGRLGLRTDTLLAKSIRGLRWRTAAPEYQAVYLLRKRHWKGDTERVGLVRQGLLGFDADLVKSVVESLAGRDVASSVHRILEGDWHAFKAPTRNLLADQQRRISRIRHPVGFWTDVIGRRSEEAAKDLARRFGRILVARAGERPRNPASNAFWLVRDIAPLRWKPGLYVSWTPGIPGSVRANLELTEAAMPTDDLAGQVVTSMESRLELTQHMSKP